MIDRVRVFHFSASDLEEDDEIEIFFQDQLRQQSGEGYELADIHTLPGTDGGIQFVLHFKLTAALELRRN